MSKSPSRRGSVTCRLIHGCFQSEMNAFLQCLGDAHTLSSCWDLSTPSRPPHLIHTVSNSCPFMSFVPTLLLLLLLQKNMKVRDWLRQGCDCLVIACKFDPIAAVDAMLPHLTPSRPFAIYSEFIEVMFTTGVCRVAKNQKKEWRGRGEKTSCQRYVVRKPPMFFCSCVICSQLHKVTWGALGVECVSERTRARKMFLEVHHETTNPHELFCNYCRPA